MLERPAAQVPDRAPYFDLTLGHESASQIQMPVGALGIFLKQPGSGIQLQRHAGQTLLEGIVQFLRQPGPFRQDSLGLHFGLFARGDLEF